METEITLFQSNILLFSCGVIFGIMIGMYIGYGIGSKPPKY